MDEPSPLKIPTVFRRLRKSPSHLLLGLAALTGCISRTPTPSPSPDTFAQLTKSVAEWRELPLHRTLRLEVRTAQDRKIRLPLAPANDYSLVAIPQIEWVYKSIGLLPNEVDLGGALAEYERNLQLIHYDRATSMISVSPDADGLGRPLAKINPAAARELPAVIAIVRALQDQQFGWRERINGAVFEDRRAALRAVGAGDALLTAVSYAARPNKSKLSTAQMQAMLQVATEIDKLAARLPDFLREQVSFPYRDGSQFVNWAFIAGAWQGVNGLYADPPTTTAQVFHPEKYFLQRERPLRFFPAALFRRFGNRPIVEQSLGELLIRTLLENGHAPREAAETAAGWRGDQLFSFQNDHGLDVFWFSSWRSETRASEFLEAYRKVLQNRQDARFDVLARTEFRTLIATRRDRRTWLLQARGPHVLALQTASENRLTESVEEAWRDLEIEPEASVVQFEFAERSVTLR